MKSAYLAILIVLSCVPSGKSQSSGSSSKPKSTCGMVISEFDKSRNETRVQLRPLLLEGGIHVDYGETLQSQNSRGDAGYGVLLNIVYTYQGQAPSKPQSFVIIIGLESKWPMYERERDLSMKLDGEVLPLGPMARAVQHTNLGFTREELSRPISYEQFMKIANAQKVKINLGKTDFNLTKCHLDALRKLASTVQP